MTDHRARHYHVDAICFDGDNLDEIGKLLDVAVGDPEPVDQLIVELPDGDREVVIGDYVIQIDNGVDYWTCAGDVFEKFYEPFDRLGRLSPPDDTDDALAWAKAFESYYPHSGLDAGLMVGWFANYAAACQRVAGK